MDWLNVLAVVFLLTGIFSALAIAVDLVFHPQKMWIMNLVWPLTGLYAGLLGWLAYQHMKGHNPKRPLVQSCALGAFHCGSGCLLGDLIAESLIVVLPFTFWGHKIFAAWVLDYFFAFVFGIAFQYFTIQPMRNLPPKKGLVQALKADTLSLSSWQLGMYGWMAIATFGIFGHELPKTSPIFWFMMQLAMGLGFCTSFPVNMWLIRKGIKEKM